MHTLRYHLFPYTTLFRSNGQRLCCVKPAPKLIKRTAQRKMFVRRRCAMEERSPPARATRSPNITNISSTFCFLMFVILGLRVALAGGLRSSIAQRRRTNIFLCAVLLISFGAGLTQHNLWPFSSWPVLAYAVPTGS